MTSTDADVAEYTLCFRAGVMPKLYEQAKRDTQIQIGTWTERYAPTSAKTDEPKVSPP